MHRDLPSVPSFGYSDMPYLGATIDGRVGEPTTFRYRNELLRHPFAADIDTTLHGVSESYRDRPPNSLHLHGAVTAPDSDGNPERLLMPRVGTAVHHYPNRQEAGHLWYHDHSMGITRTNVYAGLAGNFLLRDDHDTGDASNRLGLPSGEYELPLILQEKIFTADGHMSLRSTPVVPQGRWEGGAVGDVGMINGTVWPKITVDRGLYRFRILNAGSYSVWTLHLSDATPMWVIGNEGGVLDAPVRVRSFRIAPGERYDVLVDFSGLRPGATVDLCNREDPPFQAAMLGEVRMPVFGRFVASPRTGFRGRVPSRLRGRPGLPDVLPPLATATSVRNVTVSQPYALRLPPAIMSLNNLRYSDPQMEMPRQGPPRSGTSSTSPRIRTPSTYISSPSASSGGDPCAPWNTRPPIHNRRSVPVGRRPPTGSTQGRVRAPHRGRPAGRTPCAPTAGRSPRWWSASRPPTNSASTPTPPSPPTPPRAPSTPRAGVRPRHPCPRRRPPWLPAPRRPRCPPRRHHR